LGVPLSGKLLKYGEREVLIVNELDDETIGDIERARYGVVSLSPLAENVRDRADEGAEER
jgi:hypothetical protein